MGLKQNILERLRGAYEKQTVEDVLKAHSIQDVEKKIAYLGIVHN